MDYPATKTKPWAHQVEAWRLSKGYEGFFHALDMGTGKSKVAIDSCNGHDARLVLILCPKSVISVWPKQFDIHSANTYEIFAPTNSSVKKKALEVRRKIDKCLQNNTRLVIILNYESFWRAPLGPDYDRKNRIINSGLLLSYDWDMMILDEAHRTKTPGGKAAWGAYRLAKKARRKLLLSGTPMPHAPTDIYAQFRVLDPNIYGTSFLRFKKNYCIMGGFENRQVVKWINQDDLNSRFYSRAYRVKKEDVLDLPEFMHETRSFDLSPTAAKAYRELETEFIAQIGTGEITVDNALVKLLRLSQLTGGFIKMDNGKQIIIDNGKIDVVKDIFEDLDDKEPIVIFCQFTNEVQRVKQLAEKMNRPAGELSGRTNNLEEWQNGEVNVLAVQIRSGGVGVDVTRARYCIYMSTGCSLGDYEQSLARIHRPGQTRSVTYYHVIANNTVDEKIHRSLQAKKKVVEAILAEYVI